MEEVVINVYAIVGDSYCVAADDGEKVFEQIRQVIAQGKKAAISFLNVEMLTSAFLNTSVGKLYGEFDEAPLKNGLSVRDISNEDKELLKRVIDMAKAYYKDPDQMAKSIERVLME